MRSDRVVQVVLFVTALSSIAALLIITFFIFRTGIPAIFRIGLGNFMLGTEWAPTSGQFGILSMIAGSLAAAYSAVRYLL